MPTSALILVLARATLLFVAGFALLWLSKRSAPALRHVVCLSAIAGSLLVLPTLFLPDSAIVIHVPLAGGLAIAASAGPEGLTWAEYAAIVWACGCAVVMLRLPIGYTVLSRVRRRAVHAGEAAPGVPVFAADVSVPMLTGLFRPAILMPRTAADWPRSQRDAAIRHELAHLGRGDLRANLAGILACAIYWFHPLVWLLVQRLRAEQEAACDDVVLGNGFDRTEYANALVETARGAGGSGLLLCSMADRAGVKARVIRVLSPATPRPGSSAIGRMSTGILAALLMLLVGVSLVGAERIYKSGDGVTPPAVLRQVQPQYTEAARAAKSQGKVSLRLIVGSDGIGRDIAVVHGIDSGLDKSAVEAIKRWRFKPALHNATPVAMGARIDVNFRLR